MNPEIDKNVKFVSNGGVRTMKGTHTTSLYVMTTDGTSIWQRCGISRCVVGGNF